VHDAGGTDKGRIDVIGTHTARRGTSPIVIDAARTGESTFFKEDSRGHGTVDGGSDIHTFGLQGTADGAAERIVAQTTYPARCMSEARERDAEVSLGTCTGAPIHRGIVECAPVRRPEENHTLAQREHVDGSREIGI
jgi:hypothetical protein